MKAIPKVPHLDAKTRAKTFKYLQNVYLTLMQLLGIVTFSVALWIFLRLRIGVNCHFLTGFYSASIFLLFAGIVSIVVSTVAVAMVMRDRILVRFQHIVIVILFIMVLELCSAINATIDYYILHDSKFKMSVSQDFSEFFINDNKELDCWTALQRKFQCCGESDALDWITMAQNSSSILDDGEYLEGCQCNKKRSRTAKCRNISDIDVPFNTSVTMIYSAPCYKTMYSFIEYQCTFLRAFSSGLLALQMFNFIMAACILKKMSGMNAVQTMYMVSLENNVQMSDTNLKESNTNLKESIT